MNAIYTSSCLEVCNFRSISLYRFEYIPSFKFLTDRSGTVGSHLSPSCKYALRALADRKGLHLVTGPYLYTRAPEGSAYLPK